MLVRLWWQYCSLVTSERPQYHALGTSGQPGIITTLKVDAVEASRVLTFADRGQTLPIPSPSLPPQLLPIRGLIEQHGSDMAMQDMDIWLGLIHALAPNQTKWTQSGCSESACTCGECEKFVAIG